LEQKLKTLTEELSCHRQNAESAKRSLEQRIKEKEKELQEVRWLASWRTFYEKGLLTLQFGRKNYSLCLGTLEQACFVSVRPLYFPSQLRFYTFSTIHFLIRKDGLLELVLFMGLECNTECELLLHS
jgi:hypothetical protein